jgi:hypothetical protein
VGFTTHAGEEVVGVAILQRLEAYVLSGDNLVFALRP